MDQNNQKKKEEKLNIAVLVPIWGASVLGNFLPRFRRCDRVVTCCHAPSNVGEFYETETEDDYWRICGRRSVISEDSRLVLFSIRLIPCSDPEDHGLEGE